jgi:hypothetical protein
MLRHLRTKNARPLLYFYKYAFLADNDTESLTASDIRTCFVLMTIETIGEAHHLGWRVRVRCA